jgi:hypothetical protein
VEKAGTETFLDLVTEAGLKNPSPGLPGGRGEGDGKAAFLNPAAPENGPAGRKSPFFLHSLQNALPMGKSGDILQKLTSLLRAGRGAINHEEVTF